ncbi:MAG: DNA-directed RNA polymerase specialized sigma24 family protein [Phycisphaerales bacterium]|jgi:DNA-directed RNA polymerase specialized sigma24 family protein
MTTIARQETQRQPHRLGTRRPRAAWRPETVQLSDLRRRQESGAVDWLLLRAQWLPTADRELVEAVYREGKSAAEIARLGDASVGVVRNRIKQIVDRLCSDRLPFVVERSPSWSPTRRRVARQCVIEGHSMRAASERLGVSLHTVRRHLGAIDELYHAWLADQPRPKRAAAL